jgi:hypothetical protein
MDCANPKTIDNAHVAEKSEGEAWALLQQASDDRDIGDFKEAVQILSKACPDYTYPKLEKEFRARDFSIYLIAMEKDHDAAGMETWTNVNLQGEVGKMNNTDVVVAVKSRLNYSTVADDQYDLCQL